MGALGSDALIGIFLGSVVFGRLSDRLGRQSIFLSSFVIVTVAAFLQFFATSSMELFALRVLIGFGMGGDFTVGHAILAEFSPRKHRGALLGSFSVVWTIGYVVANVLGMSYGDAEPDAGCLLPRVFPRSLCCCCALARRNRHVGCLARDA